MSEVGELKTAGVINVSHDKYTWKWRFILNGGGGGGCIPTSNTYRSVPRSWCGRYVTSIKWLMGSIISTTRWPSSSSVHEPVGSFPVTTCQPILIASQCRNVTQIQTSASPPSQPDLLDYSLELSPRVSQLEHDPSYKRISHNPSCVSLTGHTSRAAMGERQDSCTQRRHHLRASSRRRCGI